MGSPEDKAPKSRESKPRKKHGLGVTVGIVTLSTFLLAHGSDLLSMFGGEETSSTSPWADPSSSASQSSVADGYGEICKAVASDPKIKKEIGNLGLKRSCEILPRTVFTSDGAVIDGQLFITVDVSSDPAAECPDKKLDVGGRTGCLDASTYEDPIATVELNDGGALYVKYVPVTSSATAITLPNARGGVENIARGLVPHLQPGQ